MRIRMAVLASLLAHFAALALNAHFHSWDRAVEATFRDPLTVRLQPPEPQAPKRLVQSPREDEPPEDPTDLISDKDSRGADLGDVDADSGVPETDTLSEFEDLEQASDPGKSPDAPAAAPQAQPESPAENSTLNDAVEEAPAEGVDLQISALEPEVIVPEARVPKAQEVQPRREQPNQERFEVAQAPRQPEIRQGPSRPSRARLFGGIQSKGFTSFEAHQHELGEYMLEVQARVEREWRTSIHFRFSGTSPTRAVLECSISPEGRLVSVKILDPGRSISFGPLCREAIRRAAPFPPFPFDVPVIYRNENLEIRWTFTFL